MTAQTQPPRRVLVVLIQGLGDLVLSIPALREIRRRFPAAEISLAGPVGIVEILIHEAYLDNVIPFPLGARSFRIGNLVRLLSLIRQIRRANYDLLINLTTLLNPLTWMRCSFFNWMCNPKESVGGRFADVLSYWTRGERIQLRHMIHESAMKFRLARGLIRAPNPCTPRLTIPNGASESALEIRGDEFESTCVGICAGGARPTQRWPIHELSTCMERLRELGVDRFVLLGSEKERDFTRSLRAMLHSTDFDLVGRVPIQELPSLISTLDVVLTNDTGVMHVAAAVATPVVAIFGPGVPARYAPISEPGLARTYYRKPPCGPCFKFTCSHHSCMDWIDPHLVAESVWQLARNSRHASNRALATCKE